MSAQTALKEERGRLPQQPDIHHSTKSFLSRHMLCSSRYLDFVKYFTSKKDIILIFFLITTNKADSSVGKIRFHPV